MHNKGGFFVILLAIGIVSVLGLTSLTLGFFQRLNVRKSVDRVNLLEGVYTGEILAWHEKYRNIRGLGPVEITPDSDSLVALNTNYVEELPESLGYELLGGEYESGSPVNLRTTLEFDSAQTFIRRLPASSSLSRSITSKGAAGFCGKTKFAGSRMKLRLCLSETVSKREPATSWSRLVHKGSRVIDLRSARDWPVSSFSAFSFLPSGKTVIAGSSGPFSTSGETRLSYSQTSAGRHVPTSRNWALARLNSDGTLDRSFGDYGNSTSVTPFIGQSVIQKIESLEDEKIMAFGRTGFTGDAGFHMVMARHLPTGEIDASFGEGGWLFHRCNQYSNYEFSPSEILREPSGVWLVTGTCHGGPNGPTGVILRLKANGEVDSSFGKDGWVTVHDTGGFQGVHRFLPSKQGGYIGMYSTQSVDVMEQFYVFRIKDSVTELDLSFGTSGLVLLDLKSRVNGRGTTYSLEEDKTGKLLVSGTYFHLPDSTKPIPIIFRFNANGSLDSTFGEQGVVSLITDKKFTFEDGLSYPAAFDDVAIYSKEDGKIVLYIDIHSDDGFGRGRNLLIVQLNSDGSRDTTFGSDGFFCQPFVTPEKSQNTADVHSGFRFSRLLRHANYVYYPTNSPPSTLLRFKGSDLSPDTSFGVAGRTPFYFSGSSDSAMGVGFLNDGTVLLGGGTRALGFDLHNNRTAFAALNPSTFAWVQPFGSNPEFVVPVNIDHRPNPEWLPGRSRPMVSIEGEVFNNLMKVETQPDGKMVAAGQLGAGWALARYLPDGSFDRSFGKYGVTGIELGTDFFKVAYPAFSLAVNSTGNILLGGANPTDKVVRAALAELDPEGRLVPSFGKDGKIEFEFPDGPGDKSWQHFNAVSYYGDGPHRGKILAFGSTRSLSQGKSMTARIDSYILITRHNSDGSLDTSFGKEGVVKLKAFKDPPPPAFSALGAVQNRSVAFQGKILTDGKILVSGCGWPMTYAEMGAQGNTEIARADSFVLKLDPDGNLDKSFADDGIFRYDFAPHLAAPGKKLIHNHNDCINSFVITPDERILLAPTPEYGVDLMNTWHHSVFWHWDGELRSHQSGVVLAVLTPDGVLDPSIGKGGIERVDISEQATIITDMKISPQNYIALSGHVSYAPETADFVLDLWALE